MTRTIHTRWLVDGHLDVCTPMHVGGLGDGTEIDKTLARDGLGRLVVPGTSIAGAWRAALRATNGDARASELDELLWGPRAQLNDANARASLVFVDDALAIAPGTGDPGSSPNAQPVGPVPLVRDHVGIDRRTGTASAPGQVAAGGGGTGPTRSEGIDTAAHSGVLFDEELLPRSTQLRLRVQADIPVGPEAEELDGRMAAALAVLRTGITLGAGVTHGLGRVQLSDDTRVARVQVGEGGAQALERLLRPEFTTLASVLDGEATGRQACHVPRRAHATIRWRPLTPVLVQAGGGGEDADAYPLAEPTPDDKVRLVIPGSSIRGVLRSHAEVIVRTVLDIDAPVATLAEQSDVDQVVAALFGGAPRDEQRNRDERNLPRWLGRGALTVEEVTAQIDVTWSTTWQEVMGAPRGDPDTKRGKRLLSEDARQELQRAGLRRRHHVAIDRWTGGASEGALFSVLVPENPGIEWDPMRLTVDLDRLDGTGLTDEALALLWLVLRDLRAGRLAIGSGTTRGRGSIVVDELSLEIEGTTVEAPHKGWKQAWTAWIDRGGEPLGSRLRAATEQEGTA